MRDWIGHAEGDLLYIRRRESVGSLLVQALDRGFNSGHVGIGERLETVESDLPCGSL
jgi:hypothetical protein